MSYEVITWWGWLLLALVCAITSAACFINEWRSDLFYFAGVLFCFLAMVPAIMGTVDGLNSCYENGLSGEDVYVGPHFTNYTDDDGRVYEHYSHNKYICVEDGRVTGHFIERRH